MTYRGANNRATRVAREGGTTGHARSVGSAARAAPDALRARHLPSSRVTSQQSEDTMSERDDRNTQNDDEQELERALERPRIDLEGDTEENRNLSGSTTYETLPEFGGQELPKRGKGGDTGGSQAGGQS